MRENVSSSKKVMRLKRCMNSAVVFSQMRARSSIVLVVYFLFVFLVDVSDCDQHEYNLIHTIMKGYDPSIRPSQNHNHTLNVTFGLALTQLIDVVRLGRLQLKKNSFFVHKINWLLNWKGRAKHDNHDKLLANPGNLIMNIKIR